MCMNNVDLKEVMILRSQVQHEIDRNLRLHHGLETPRRWDKSSLVLSGSLLAASIIIMLFWSSIPLLWVIVTFVLYSFNYLIFFLPISRHPGERKVEKRVERARKDIGGPLRYLLKKKRKFALEVGATMFLVGMVPLALGFFLLFGTGLAFTIYYGVLQDVYPIELTIGLIIQILIIMAYFVLVTIVSPQSQGFTKIARSFKYRILTAHSKGRPAYIWAIAVSGVIIVVISLIGIGAILLPGRTMNSIVEFFRSNGTIPVLLFLVILVSQFFIMRSFQSRRSRKMALALIEQEVQELRSECLAPLDALIEDARSKNLSQMDGAAYEAVLYSYYPLAIYDVVETNIFGYSPVFLVVPKIDLLLDEEVLRYVGMPRDMDGNLILPSA